MLLLCLFWSGYADFSGSYMSYELVAHFDLSLDLFLGDFWISSHYSLTPPEQTLKQLEEAGEVQSKLKNQINVVETRPANNHKTTKKCRYMLNTATVTKKYTSASYLTCTFQIQKSKLQKLQIQIINPFTAPVCNISGLKYAGACLQTVYFPVL